MRKHGREKGNTRLRENMEGFALAAHGNKQRKGIVFLSLYKSITTTFLSLQKIIGSMIGSENMKERRATLGEKKT